MFHLMPRVAFVRSAGSKLLDDPKATEMAVENKRMIERKMARGENIEIVGSSKTPRELRASPPKRVY